MKEKKSYLYSLMSYFVWRQFTYLGISPCHTWKNILELNLHPLQCEKCFDMGNKFRKHDDDDDDATFRAQARSRAFPVLLPSST